MGKRKDRALIYAAADDWHEQLTYMAKQEPDKDIRRSYKKHAKKLRAALIREGARARANGDLY
ncbi:hypothetical protein SEA_BRUHMOMENT_61 [Arthrobacter phage BruhMoment]|nr:hypothetical protein SEA_BRUHMOMENT_61 [Arthrobacter phage BruhMoment]